MRFWKTKILFTIYKDKPPNEYMWHCGDGYNSKDVTKHWRNVFSYMGKNGIKEISTEEISKEEWLAYWKRCGYDEPYGIK